MRLSTRTKAFLCASAAWFAVTFTADLVRHALPGASDSVRIAVNMATAVVAFLAARHVYREVRRSA